MKIQRKSSHKTTKKNPSLNDSRKHPAPGYDEKKPNKKNIKINPNNIKPNSV